MTELKQRVTFNNGLDCTSIPEDRERRMKIINSAPYILSLNLQQEQRKRWSLLLPGVTTSPTFDPFAGVISIPDAEFTPLLRQAGRTYST